MCGIFGWQLSEEARELGDLNIAASILALSNESRGPDSFGWAFYDSKDKGIRLYKEVGRISERATFNGVLSLQGIFHTRKATTGAVTKDNAHPWEIGGILGAHNGMIFDHDGLNTKYKRNYSVDSQHLIAHIAEGLSLETISGWGAVEYFKRDEPETVYIGATATGSLAVASILDKNNEGKKGIFWSSESRHLHAALSMAGYKYRMLKLKDNKLYSIVDCALHKAGPFKLGSVTNAYGRYASNEYSDCVHPCGYSNYKQWVKPSTQYEKDKLGETSDDPPIVVINKQTLSDTVECESCLAWHPMADSTPTPGTTIKHDEIYFLYSIDKWLCGKCLETWAQQGRIDKRVVTFPYQLPHGEQLP